MPKQLNVNLAFTADTHEAKAQLASLQQDLNKLTQSVGSKSPLGITKDISSAIGEVNKLQAALKNATTNSGNLDLGQFRKELGTANLDAHKIAETLNSLGPEGQAAFAKLAQSVTLAEVPIKKVNNTLSQFATTLANTARWQLSSTVLHGFMGALQGAYRYAQDLNKSLNSIRVVTGQSSDQMAEFAKHANESAKALSATTTAYTDASLIFFQQGLTGDAVTERTDAVIKMSNVTGDSVEEVASYMTAIWNNFDEGSESLEHYADVITALGAATASSSAEISAGLEKFASIAGTVGLSYDYATSALATVVATTRQSADTVGTAFKTLFARIQGLKLGETLDDGVTLNKYSEALNAVGVQVLDLSGEMRDLDDILDDLAARWKLLSSAQQTALAQTVAGTRQYNQLVALMSNWDFMEENLEVARNAEGSLQRQADIYAESWEAAQKRVKAAWQEIYDQLLDDKFFISLTNGFGKVLDEISNVIDAFGGLKGILPLLSSALLGLFGKQLSDSINNATFNIELFSKKGQESLERLRDSFNQQNLNNIGNKTVISTATADVYTKQAEAQNALLLKSRELAASNKEISEFEQIQAEQLLDQLKIYSEIHIKNAQILEQEQAKNNTAYQNAISIAKNFQERYSENYNDTFKANGLKDDFTVQINNIHELQSQYTALMQLFDEFREKSIITSDDIAQSGLDSIINKFKELNTEGDKNLNNLIEKLEQLKNVSSENIDQEFNNLVGDIENLGEISFWSYDKLKQFISILKSLKGDNAIPKDEINDLENSIENLFNTTSQTGEALASFAKSGANVQNASKAASEAFSQFAGNVTTLGDKIITGVRAFSTFGMTLSSITGLIDTLNSPDTSGIDKFIASLTSLGMIIPMLRSSIKSLNADLGINVLALQENAIATMNLIASRRKETTEIYANIAAEKISTLTRTKEIAGIEKEILEEISLMGIKKEEVTVDTIKLALEQKGIKLSNTKLGALIQRILGEKALNEELKKQIILETTLKGFAGFAIAGAAVAIMGAVAAAKLYNQYLENVAKKSKETADNHKKLTDEISEETDKISDLADKYDELRKKEKEGTISQDELKQEVVKLSEEYDNQRLAVLALANEYGNLDNVIKQIKEDSNEELFKSSGIDVTNYKVTLKDKLATAAGGRTDNLGDTLDLRGMINRNSNEEAFAKELQQINENFFKNSDHIYTDALADAIMYHREELEAVLAKYSDVEGSQDIVKWMQGMSDEIDNASESLDRYQESALNLAFSQNFDKDKFDLSDLMDQIREDERVKASQASEEQVRDWVLKQIAGIEEVASYAQAYQIALTLYDKEGTQEQLDQLAEQIDKFEDSEKAWIILHPHIVEDYMNNEGQIDIDKIKKDYQNQFVYTEQKGNATQAMNFMTEYAQQGSFSDINSVADLLGIDTTSFSDEEIYNKLNEFYTKSLESANNFYNEAKQEADIYAKEMNEKLLAAQPSAEQIETANENALNKLKEARHAIIPEETEEQLENTVALRFEDFQKYAEGYAEALREDKGLSEDLLAIERDLINVFGEDALKEILEGTEEEAGYLEQVVPDLTNLNNKVDEANNLVNNTTELIDDFAQKAENAQSIIKRLNGSIDDLQKAYKSVAAVQKEYGEKGYYSVDSIQSLLDLGPEYLKYLSVEKDQIVIDTQAVVDQQSAYYDLLEAQYTEYYQAQMNIILKAQETKETNNATVALYSQALVQHELNGSLLEFVSECAAAAEGTGVYADALNGLAETAQKTYDILTLGREGLGNADLEGVMNATPKGGSSGGSKDRKEVKEYIKEFDKLYPIKKAVEDLTDAISDLDKKKSHLMGKSLSDALAQENEMLAQQRDLYEDLIHQQADYRDELAGALQQFGATFDTNTGNLTNYLEITEGALAKYNEAVDAYNSSHDKGAFSAADEEYKYFKEVLSAYQTILTDMQDTQNKLDDNFLQQIENNLKGFEAEIEVDLNFDEAQRKVNNFFKDIDTNFKKMYKSTKEWANIFTTASKNVDTYTKGAGSTIQTELRALEEVAGFINNKGWESDSPDRLFASRDDAIKKYEELSNQLMSDAQDLYDLYEDTWNNYLDAIDEVKSQWNDILKGFDRIDSSLKHYEKVAELLYGGDQYAAGRDYLDQIYSASSANSLAKQDTLRQEIDALRQEYDQILAMGVDETDKDLIELKEAIQEAESSLESEIESYLSTIQSKLTNSIKSIMDTANKSMTKGYGVDLVIERWNDAKDAAEGYYDEVERIYELEKLESAWEKAISDTTTLKNQQYLTNIMNEQLKNLREKTKLSEYDIGLAERELQVYQAQMALEDARENKNAMKLVRNEQGNWAYQYVADEDDVADKEEDLTNKLYEKYEYVKNANNEAVESLLQLYQTAQERLSELLEEYKYADEERRLEIAEQYNYLYDYYYGPEGVIIQKASEAHAMEDDLNIAGMELLWDLYEKDLENYDLMIQSEKELIDGLREHNITSFTELITAVATGDDSLYNQLLDKVTQVTNDSRTQWQELAREIVGDWATNPDSVRAAVSFAYDSIMIKVAQYDLAIAASEKASGIAWTNITAAVNNTEIAIELVHEMVNQVIKQTDALDGFRQKVNDIGDEWYGVAEKIKSAAEMLSGFLGMLGQSANFNIQQIELPLNPKPSNKTFSGDGDSSGGGNSKSSNRVTQYMIVGQDTYGHDNAIISTNGGQGYATREAANAAATQMYNDARGSLGNLRVEAMTYQTPAQRGASQADIDRARGSLTNIYDAITSGNLAQINYGDFQRYMDSGITRYQTNALSSIHGGVSAYLNSMTPTVSDPERNAYINIQNLDLPNVTNYTEFIEAMQAAVDLYNSWNN